MKLSTKQIYDTISETLLKAISVETVSKKLKKIIKTSSIKIAKKVAKIKKKENNEAKKIAKQIIKKVVPIVVETSKLTLAKVALKKPASPTKTK